MSHREIKYIGIYKSWDIVDQQIINISISMSYQVDGRTGNLVGGAAGGKSVHTHTYQGQPTTKTTTYTTTEYVQQPTATTYTSVPTATYTNVTATAVPVSTVTAVPVQTYSQVPVTTYATSSVPVVTSHAHVGSVAQVSTGEVIKGNHPN